MINLDKLAKIDTQLKEIVKKLQSILKTVNK